jgi:hypothetical protein
MLWAIGASGIANTRFFICLSVDIDEKRRHCHSLSLHYCCIPGCACLCGLFVDVYGRVFVPCVAYCE